jgi:uncharacterized protein (TIGR03083 family)
MSDPGTLYAEGRQRISQLVSGLSDEQAAQPVRTCPKWSVHDVLAHVVGISADIVAGNIEGVATDPWTAKQVADRVDRSIAELLAEWESAAAQVEPIVQFFPGRVAEQLVLDLTEHEHDIRYALGRPGARDAPAIDTSLGIAVDVLLTPALVGRGLGPVELQAGDRRKVAGTGGPPVEAADELSRAILIGSVEPPPPVCDPVITLEAPAFDLVRALTGRRSAKQIAAFGWSDDPTPYIPAFASGPFTLSPVDILE